VRGNEDIVYLLLEKGANVDVKMLLKEDGDVTVQYVDWRTALHCVAVKGHDAIVRVLLDNDIWFSNAFSSLTYSAISSLIHSVL